MVRDMEIRDLLDQFLKKKRLLIPVILPGRKGMPRLPSFLGHFHAVDFRKEDPDPLEQLIWGITGEHGLKR